MSDYTPTTEEIRKSFIYGERYKSDKMYPVVHPDRIKDIEDDFDCWLESIMQKTQIVERERIIKLFESWITPCEYPDNYDMGFEAGVREVIALIKGENK